MWFFLVPTGPRRLIYAHIALKAPPPLSKTDVTPVISSLHFVAQIYRATKLQHATVHVAHCDLSHEHELTNQLGQCLFMRQSWSVRHAELHAATLPRDKIAGVTSV